MKTQPMPTAIKMRTLQQVFNEDLNPVQKKSLLAGLCQRWDLTEVNVRKSLKKDRYPNTTYDIGYMHEFHAIGFNHKCGFFLDLDRMKEIKEFGLPIPQLFGMSL
ncbi:hypothetical protein [Runella sp.]|uniref:hypothetical protein n=1 Tax=Runella sp. TaxID=1960881 RepID=UPI003D12079C